MNIASASGRRAAPSADELPGPTGLLGWRGNLLRFFADPTGFMQSLRTRYGEVAGLARGHRDYVFAFGARHNRMVLGNTALFHNLDASNIPVRVPPRSALARLFSGLIQMNGDRHTQQRRLMTPAFNRRALESYLDDVTSVIRDHVDAWRVGDCRDAAQEMSDLTLSIAMKVLLGLDPDQAGERVRALFREWTRLVFSLTTLSLPYDVPGLPYRRLLAISELLVAELHGIIRRKRMQDCCDSSILTAMLSANDADQTVLTDDEVVGQTNFLCIAGHATTTNALIWTLFLLDRHPDIWDAVHAECAQLDVTRPMIERLQNMTMLEAAITESLRLMPPVLWWCRISTTAFQLDRYHFAAGTKVIQSAYITHRDPDVYREPKRFIPQRWLGRTAEPYEYCPFSAGPRMCLGASLAVMEIKIALSLIIQRFRTAVPTGSRVDIRGPMILAPKSKVPIALLRVGSHHEQGEVRGNIKAVLDLPLP